MNESSTQPLEVGPDIADDSCLSCLTFEYGNPYDIEFNTTNPLVWRSSEKLELRLGLK